MTISDLFVEKVLEMRGFQVGDKVHYDDMHKKNNGIVKSIPQPGQAFVVYYCGDDWENYEKYTGILTDFKYLKLGWYDDDTVPVERGVIESDEY